MGERPLSERDIETLEYLLSATDDHLRMNYRDGWVMTMDCGGTNGSHHSATLKKLADRGLCERWKLGSAREKGSCRWKINDAGRKFCEAVWAEKKAKRTVSTT